MKPLLYLIIILLIFCISRQCQMKTFCKFTNAICESRQKSWVIINQCRLRAISRNKTTLNIEINLLEPANTIDVQVLLKTKAFGYKPSLFNYTIDGCTFIEKRLQRTSILFYNIIEDYTNVNHSCPYVGLQIVKDFNYDPSIVTLPIPGGDYILALKWILNKKLALITTLYFTFSQDVIAV